MKKIAVSIALALMVAGSVNANPPGYHGGHVVSYPPQHLHPHPHPHPQPYPTPPSGLMLGVRIFENWQGLRVISTIPGEAAHGVLRRDDIILRMALPNGQIFDTRRLASLEYAKDVIGPGQTAAIEINRPGWGLQYFYVTLRPVGGGGVYSRSHNGVAAAPQMKTEIRRAPGAAAMFNGGGQPSNGSRPTPQPSPRPQPQGGGAQSFFGQ